MTKPSERIVVFVTPAQKRAIAATADELGISVSELMRRAVLNFGATSEQVKAASIVDRLNAPRAPDALDMALKRVAHDTRHAQAALPPALQTRVGRDARLLADPEPNGAQVRAAASAASDAAHKPTPSVATARADSVLRTPASRHTSQPAFQPAFQPASQPPVQPPAQPAPLLPADVLAALTTEIDEDAVATAAAVARIAAARAGASDTPLPAAVTAQPHVRSVLKRPRLDTTRDDDDPQSDLGPEGGRFA